MTDTADLVAGVLADELGISKGTAKICLGIAFAATSSTRRGHDRASLIFLAGLLEEASGLAIDVDELRDSIEEADQEDVGGD